jgi:predicted DNA-binding WGR domain protein
MSNARRFEFVEGSSNKFWEVWTEGPLLKTRYGKIGAVGQITRRNEGSEAQALEACEKLIREKTGKGYVEKTVAPATVALARVAPRLRGLAVVISGTLKQPRADLEKRLVAAGCTVGDSVTKQTDLLVVGADALLALAVAVPLGVAVMTEVEVDALLAGAEAVGERTPSPTASTEEWQVNADRLEAAGDPKGQVLALQLALEATPDDASLRAAEREARTSLLVGPLADALRRFDALVARLTADPAVVLLASFTHPPVSERELTRVEQALGAPLHPSIATFFRQTNGLQLYADRRDREQFEEGRFAPLTSFDRRAMARFSENSDLSYGLHLPPLGELFLTEVASQLGYAQDLDDEQTVDFGQRSFGRSAFAKSLRLVDVHNGYHPIALSLLDHPENPRLGLGDDYGVDWSATRTVDFETFIGAVLEHDARQEKLERFFLRE